MIILMVDIHCKHPSSNGNILIAEHPETEIMQKTLYEVGKRVGIEQGPYHCVYHCSIWPFTLRGNLRPHNLRRLSG